MPSARMSCFLDTNLLIYALDPAEPAKRERAALLLRMIAREDGLVLSAQSINECYRVLVFRRKIMAEEEARAFLSTLEGWCKAPLDFSTVRLAWEVRDTTGFSYWDCVLLASALQAGCSTFLSEDMRAGKVGTLTIVNPFTMPLDHVLAQL